MLTFRDSQQRISAIAALPEKIIELEKLREIMVLKAAHTFNLHFTLMSSLSVGSSLTISVRIQTNTS